MSSVDARSQIHKQLSCINVFRRCTNDVPVMQNEFRKRNKLGNWWIIYEWFYIIRKAFDFSMPVLEDAKKHYLVSLIEILFQRLNPVDDLCSCLIIH